MADANNPLQPGFRSVVLGPPKPEAPTKAIPRIGAKLTPAELRKELILHGFHPNHITRLFNQLPSNYEGHKQCLECKHFIPSLGFAIAKCPMCNHCRHAGIESKNGENRCVDCGLIDPPSYEMKPEHFLVHYLTEDGEIERTETH